MTRRQQSIQGTNALGEFLAQIDGIEVPHRKPRELNPAGLVMCFERFPDEIDRTHIVVRLQIQNGGDASFLPQPVNVIGSLRVRTEEESRKNLGIVHRRYDIAPLESTARPAVRKWLGQERSTRRNGKGRG